MRSDESASVDPFISRSFIRERAYADDSKLNARREIWRYVVEMEPPHSALGRVRNAIDLDGSELVVDIGCGNGADLSVLASADHLGPLIGMDLSVGMLSAIQEPRILRALGDAMALPFATSSADVVLAMHMLYHVPDIPKAIAEARRVLRRGGVLVASTNSSNSMRELMEVWREALSTAAGQPIDLHRDSATRFSLENGGELLSGSFSSIELKRFRGVLRVPDSRVVRSYVDSTRDLYDQPCPTLRSGPRRWT